MTTSLQLPLLEDMSSDEHLSSRSYDIGKKTFKTLTEDSKRKVTSLLMKKSLNSLRD